VACSSWRCSDAGCGVAEARPEPDRDPRLVKVVAIGLTFPPNSATFVWASCRFGTTATSNRPGRPASGKQVPEILAEAAPGETTKDLSKHSRRANGASHWSRAPWDGGARPASQGIPQRERRDAITELLREWEGQSQTSTFGVTRWLSGLRRWRCALRTARRTCSVDACVHALAVGVASGVPRRARLSADLYACTSIAAGLAEEHGDDYSDLSPEERYVYVSRAISVETTDRRLAMMVDEFRRSAMMLSKSATILGSPQVRPRVAVDLLSGFGEGLIRPR